MTTLERNIAGSESMTELLHQGLSASDITEKLLQGLGVSDNVFTMEPSYGPCEPSALQDRMKRAVALLGAEEIDKLLEEEGKIEVSFHLLLMENGLFLAICVALKRANLQF